MQAQKEEKTRNNSGKLSNLANLQDNYIGSNKKSGRRSRANTDNFLVLPGAKEEKSAGDDDLRSRGSIKDSLKRIGSGVFAGLIGGLGLGGTPVKDNESGSSSHLGASYK